MFPFAKILRGANSRCTVHIHNLLKDRCGNIAFTFGILSLPVLVAVGASVDYVRAYNVRTKMQTDLDAALIAAVKDVDSLDEDKIRAKVGQWFAAQAEFTSASYVLDTDTISVSKTKRTIQAVATGQVATTLLGIADVNSISVSVATSVAGPSTSFLNVYLVLDKSASMMLAATSSGQTAMKNYAESSCVFACHTAEGDSKPYNGVVYHTNYALAKAMGVKLRTDVSLAAASEVLSQIATSDPTQSRIKVGLYSIGSDAVEALAPTFSTTTAKSVLNDDSKGLTSATSYSTTRFETALATLATKVGSAGDGTSASKPLKLVLILSDGVQSERPWVVASDNTPKQVTPLNPDWCKSMKTAGATVGVLYTEYLPMTWDWGYNRTLDMNMSSSAYASMWKGTLDSSVKGSISRLDYIPYALKACASSKDMFISAADSSAIEQGLSALFQQYLGSVRLTQ